jgi:hypothetical protein
MVRAASWTSVIPLYAMVALGQGVAPVEARPEPTAAAPTAEPPAADGWQRPPAQRLLLTSLTAVRYNALGLYEQLRFGGQWQLYRHDSPLLRDNFLHLGLISNLAPAYARLGPMVEVQPASVFSLRAYGEFLGYFTTFGYLQSFQSPQAVWSDTALRAGRDLHQDYSTWGVHAALEPMLMARLPLGDAGHLAFRNKLAFEYWYLSLRTPAGGRTDTVFYEGGLDMLIAGNGWVVQDDLDVMLQTRFGLNLGLRYSAIVPLYRATDFASAAEAQAYANDNVNQRLGLFAAYTFFDHGFSRFNKPTLIFIANWYLQSRFRTGADVTRALPYLALAFAFQSDLLD